MDPTVSIGQPSDAADDAAGQDNFNIMKQDEGPSRLTDRLWYCIFVSITVIANLQVLALETDYGCVKFDCTASQRMPWYVFDHVFTVLFIIDIIMNIVDLGPKGYFRGDPLKQKLGFHTFHVLDCLVVLLRVIDVWALDLTGNSTGLKLVSMVRIIHLTRFAKRMRLVPAFSELWLVVAGLRDTMKVVAWVMVLLVLLLWVFATFVTLALETDSAYFDFKRSAWPETTYWGNVPKSMYSLFQVLTGDKWSHSLAWPLIKKRPILVVAFIAFRAMGLLALLNTIVGVVVETTLTAATANKERKDKEKFRRDAMVMESLREIFRRADTDGGGELDEAELQAAMKNPVVRGRLKMLEIPVKDLRWLFNLLDEGEKLVKTDSFFRGCSRLRGPAMAMDLHQMSIDLDRHIVASDDRITKTKDSYSTLSSLLDHIDEVDVDIVKGDADLKDPVLVGRRTRQRQPKANALRSMNWMDYQPPAPLFDTPSENDGKSPMEASWRTQRHLQQASTPVRQALPTPSSPTRYEPPRNPPPPPPRGY